MIIPAMVDIFASLVRAGRRTIESLPLAYQQPVAERLGMPVALGT